MAGTPSPPAVRAAEKPRGAGARISGITHGRVYAVCPVEELPQRLPGGRHWSHGAHSRAGPTRDRRRRKSHLRAGRGRCGGGSPGRGAPGAPLWAGLPLRSQPGPRSGTQQGGHGVALGAPASRMLTCIWGVRGSDICGWSCVPPNPCVEAPNPNVTVFGDRTFKEVVEVK